MARASPLPGSPASPVRGTVRIPKDQAALLDKSKSWIASLQASNHSLGLVNLPAKVLAPLTDFHRKRLQNRLVSTETEGSRKRDAEELPGELQENAGGKDSTSRCTTPEAGATDLATPTEERAVAVNHGSDDSIQKLGSPPEIVYPWTPSPNRGPAKAAERSSSPDVAQTRPQPQLPSSSLELEEELEVVTPRGIRDSAGPTNLGTARHLSPSPTPGYTSSPPPPCGQGNRHLVDADFDEETEDDMQADSASTDRACDVPGRRSRRMQGPVFPSVTPQKTSHFGNRHATAKIQPAPSLSMLDSSQASLSSIDAQTSPAGDNPTSSCEASGPGKRQNPHTPNPDLIDEASSKRLRTSDTVHRHPARQETLPSPSRKEIQQAPAEDLPTSAGRASEQMRQTPNPDLNQGPPSMRRRTSQRYACHEGPARQDILIPATPFERWPDLIMAGRTAQPVRHPKPFETYREAYPEYHGTLADFINACISLEYIQRQNLMRDLLYDDFIHAWVEGYVGYVAKYGDGALPANQWFNRLGGGVECDKTIITRKNLYLVPEAYPEAYPKEYRQDLRAFKLDQSPERPIASRALAQTIRPGSSQEVIPRFGQATPKVIPATQSPRPTALDQRSRSGPPYHHPGGKRPVYSQTPHSVIAESPFKRVVTPKDMTPQQGLVSEERPSPLAPSKIARLSIVPVGIRDNSDTDDFSPTRATAHAPEEAGTTPMRQNGDDRLGSPSAPIGDSDGGLTGHDITSPDPLSEGSNPKHAGTSDRLSERRVRSPDLHSSAYASPSPPRRNDSNDDGLRNEDNVPAEAQYAEVYASPRMKEKETRGPRHSIATGNPRASSGNDKRVVDGRVQKDTGRKSLGSKVGQEESERSGRNKKKKKKKKRRVTMEEALQEFVLKRWAEKAAASPASGQSPAAGH